MADKPIKLTRGVPAVESFRPLQLAECAQAVLLQHSDVVLQYGPSRGFAPLRELIAREAGVDPHRVLIGQGSLQLQDLCGRVMIRPGDVVYVEEPSYDRALTVLRRTGGQLVGFTLGESGPNVGEIEARLESGERPVLFYVIPDFQNPSGQVMPAETRRRIAALARQYDFYIIEDSPYRRLRYRGQDVPTIFEYAPERVLQMSSYSKLISPGLRVGYVIAPEALADRLARMAEDTYINPSYLNQAIAYEYGRRGWLEPHIADLKALYRPRLDAMLDALDRHMTGLGVWSKPDGGFFISLILHKNVHAKDLVHRAEQVNLQLTDGRGFFVASGGDRFVRLPFCALTPQEIEDGIARLADVVRAP
jgi:DNA-binding transcriptional MocR family regulator